MANPTPNDNPPTELCATVIALTPVRAGTFPASQAQASHALFLRLTAAADPPLAAHLHEGAQAKPFTCGNLWKQGVGSRGVGSKEEDTQHAARHSQPATRNLRLTSCAPGETWYLRYTTLTGDLTRLWLERVLPALPDQVVLGEVPFRVQGVATEAAAHPWAGCASYASLAAPYLLSQVPAPTHWSFAFAAPTAFRSGGMTVPIPLPHLLFGSLLDRWNAWSPVALNPEVRRFAQECVAVSNYRLRTRALPGKDGHVQRGAVGRCDYAALNKDRYWCSTLSALAAFAFYSGAGYQTTQGMGTVRWLDR